LPVHVFGNACEVDELATVCRNNNLKLIYDAAHAFNVSDGDRNVLTYGDASTLSFHATKIFHTIEGGAIILHTEEQYHKAKLLINFGISGYDKVDILGINCKMNEFQAAMGLSVLDEFEQINQQRGKVWEKYRDSFTGMEHLQLQDMNTRFGNNYSYFPVAFKDEEHLLDIVQRLNREDINPRRYFYPSLNKLEYLDQSSSCPVSESLASRILCLPMFPDLDEKIQERIIRLVSEN
jgi:dTDP-4-amino-4,6-dideoxygalactose transaminase